MKRYDFETALLIWIVSVVAACFYGPALLVLVATTFNLWHQRKGLYAFGTPFETRVRAIYQADLAAFEVRLKEADRKIQDIEAASVKLQSRLR